MDDDPAGFDARKPIGAWNKDLGVDYPGVFKAILKASLAAGTGNPVAAVNAAIDGMFAFGLRDKPMNPAELVPGS